MARLVWTTDIHFDFVTPAVRREFIEKLNAQAPDLVLITGDIGEAPTTPAYLREIGDALSCPVYFVLGNHDYYFSDIDAVRAAVRVLAAENPRLHYLTDSGIVPLSSSAVMIGHDGWSDGGYGDFFASEVMMSDYVYIKDLANIGVDKRLQKLRALGDEGAAHLKKLIPEAVKQANTVYIAFHPVPFREVCMYEGQAAQNDNPYLPHFSSKAVGDVLIQASQQHPQTQFIALCGHTHDGCDMQIAPNLRVLVGHANYEHPVINGIFDV